MPRMPPSLPACIERDPPASARWSVIWLHGLGADGHDFEPLASELGLPGDHGVRFVFPHAPERPVTINGGMRMRAWYDITTADVAAGEDAEGILASVAALEALIAREADQGVPAARVIVGGFSQGGAIALHAGLRQRAPLAGIVALSAYLPLADRIDAAALAANHDTPVFQGHGRHDPIVPIALGEHTRDHLAALRVAPTWRTYAMEHAVCGDEIADLRAWLLEVTAA